MFKTMGKQIHSIRGCQGQAWKVASGVEDKLTAELLIYGHHLKPQWSVQIPGLWLPEGLPHFRV